MPLSLLSYASILGISSTLLVICVVLYDGISKTDSPGSLWHPAETNWTVAGVGELGVAFGLFMAGVSYRPGQFSIEILISDILI